MSLARWYEMHAEDVQQAAEGEAPLVFIGDSITEGWAAEGAAEWARYFGPRGAVNFGIGGDMTQNLIWRLHNGAAGQLDPSAVVLLIGVNNLSFSTDGPATIGAGVIAVVDALEDSFPKADILLLGVLPAGASAQDPLREKIRLINQLVANLDQREMVTFLDTGALFLEPDGSISSEIMPDYLHLSPEAYKRWAAAISPWVEQHLK
jgi:lysophospholipase L1-like esterase